MGYSIHRHDRFINVKVPTLIFTSTNSILLFLHELADISKVELTEFISIHRNINVQLLNF